VPPADLRMGFPRSGVRFQAGQPAGWGDSGVSATLAYSLLVFLAVDQLEFQVPTDSAKFPARGSKEFGRVLTDERNFRRQVRNTYLLLFLPVSLPVAGNVCPMKVRCAAGLLLVEKASPRHVTLLLYAHMGGNRPESDQFNSVFRLCDPGFAK